MNSTHESNSPVTFPIDSCSTQNPTQRQIHRNDRSILLVGDQMALDAFLWIKPDNLKFKATKIVLL